MSVVNQWMPPSHLPPTPHCTLITGHKGPESVRRCIGQTRFLTPSKHKVRGTFTLYTLIYRSPASHSFPASLTKIFSSRKSKIILIRAMMITLSLIKVMEVIMTGIITQLAMEAIISIAV